MTYLHEDRTIWVTGAASGIGKAAAEEILSEGGYVIGSDLPTADFSWAEGVDNMRCVTGSVSFSIEVRSKHLRESFPNYEERARYVLDQTLAALEISD